MESKIKPLTLFERAVVMALYLEQRRLDCTGEGDTKTFVASAVYLRKILGIRWQQYHKISMSKLVLQNWLKAVVLTDRLSVWTLTDAAYEFFENVRSDPTVGGWDWEIKSTEQQAMFD